MIVIGLNLMITGAGSGVGGSNFFLLADGASAFLLADGSSKFILV